MRPLHFIYIPREKVKHAYQLLRQVIKAPCFGADRTPEEIQKAYGVILSELRNQILWNFHAGWDCGLSDQDIEDVLSAGIELFVKRCQGEEEFTYPGALLEQIAIRVFNEAVRRRSAEKRGGRATIMPFDPQWRGSNDPGVIAVGSQVESIVARDRGIADRSVSDNDVLEALKHLVTQRHVTQREADIYYLFRCEEADWQSIALGYKCYKDTIYRTVHKIDQLLRQALSKIEE